MFNYGAYRVGAITNDVTRNGGDFPVSVYMSDNDVSTCPDQFSAVSTVLMRLDRYKLTSKF